MPCQSQKFTLNGINPSKTLSFTAPPGHNYAFAVFVSLPLLGSVTAKVLVNGAQVASKSSPTAVSGGSYALYLNVSATPGDQIQLVLNYTGLYVEYLNSQTVKFAWLDEEEGCVPSSVINLPILSSVKAVVCTNFSKGYVHIYSGLPTAKIPPCADPGLTLVKSIPVHGSYDPSTCNTVTFQMQGPLSSTILQQLQQGLESNGAINVKLSGNTLSFQLCPQQTGQAQIQIGVFTAIAIAAIIIAVAVAISIVYISVTQAPTIASAVGKGASSGIATGFTWLLALVGAGIGVGIAVYAYNRSRSR